MSNRLKTAGFLLFVLAASYSAFSSSGIQRSALDKPRLGGTLRIKLFDRVFKPNLDPAGDSYYFILEQLYDGLVRLDDHFNVVPCLAEYWVISEEGKKITFSLRKGVEFHNGLEMTSEDVKFSLERLIRKSDGSPYYQYFTTRVVGAEEFRQGKAADVEGFKVPDRYTFEIHWKNPYVSGLYLLSMSFCKILPGDSVLSQGRSFFMKPSGTGAFKFGYWLRNPRLDIVGVRLERNEGYFGELPYLDVVEFSPYYTVDQFKDGDVHIIPLQSEGLASGRYPILENNSLDLFFLGLSCRIPPLDRKDIRQALALALDKASLARAALSFESIPKVLNNFIPADLPGFFPQETRNEPNLDMARRKLADAGFKSGRDFPRLFLCFILPRTDSEGRLYREIRRQFEALGIRLEMKYFRSEKEIESFPEPHIMIIERLMDFPDAENVIMSLFHSQSILNKMSVNYASSLVDKLLAASEIETSWERRTALFRQMEGILFEDVPAIPLFQLRLRLALQPYVRGAKALPLGFYCLDVKNIWLDR